MAEGAVASLLGVCSRSLAPETIQSRAVSATEIIRHLKETNLLQTIKREDGWESALESLISRCFALLRHSSAYVQYVGAEVLTVVASFASLEDVADVVVDMLLEHHNSYIRPALARESLNAGEIHSTATVLGACAALASACQVVIEADDAKERGAAAKKQSDKEDKKGGKGRAKRQPSNPVHKYLVSAAALLSLWGAKASESSLEHLLAAVQRCILLVPTSVRPSLIELMASLAVQLSSFSERKRRSTAKTVAFLALAAPRGLHTQRLLCCRAVSLAASIIDELFAGGDSVPSSSSLVASLTPFLTSPPLTTSPQDLASSSTETSLELLPAPSSFEGKRCYLFGLLQLIASFFSSPILHPKAGPKGDRSSVKEGLHLPLLATAKLLLRLARGVHRRDSSRAALTPSQLDLSTALRLKGYEVLSLLLRSLDGFGLPFCCSIAKTVLVEIESMAQGSHKGSDATAAGNGLVVALCNTAADLVAAGGTGLVDTFVLPFVLCCRDILHSHVLQEEKDRQSSQQAKLFGRDAAQLAAGEAVFYKGPSRRKRKAGGASIQRTSHGAPSEEANERGSGAVTALLSSSGVTAIVDIFSLALSRCGSMMRVEFISKLALTSLACLEVSISLEGDRFASLAAASVRSSIYAFFGALLASPAVRLNVEGALAVRILRAGLQDVDERCRFVCSEGLSRIHSLLYPRASPLSLAAADASDSTSDNLSSVLRHLAKQAEEAAVDDEEVKDVAARQEKRQRISTEVREMIMPSSTALDMGRQAAPFEARAAPQAQSTVFSASFGTLAGKSSTPVMSIQQADSSKVKTGGSNDERMIVESDASNMRSQLVDAITSEKESTTFPLTSTAIPEREPPVSVPSNEKVIVPSTSEKQVPVELTPSQSTVGKNQNEQVTSTTTSSERRKGDIVRGGESAYPDGFFDGVDSDGVSLPSLDSEDEEETA